MTRWCATGQQPALGQSSTQSPAKPSESNSADDPNPKDSRLLPTEAALGKPIIRHRK